MNQDRSMDTFNNHIEPKSIHMEKEVKKGQEEEEKEEEEEEESYPSELVPEGALTPFEKELSPEQDMSVPEATKQKEEKVKNTEILIEKKEENEMKKVEEEKKEEIKKTEEEKKNPASDAHDYAEVIIDALVFSRTSSMPISDICSRILKANPAYAEQPREIWIERIRTVLKDKPFFGEIQRKGKTADGSPKENLYYYNSELDPVEWRRATYTQVGRSARKCTLKDKQYFWKIPPKLGRHRNSYIPPPASEHKRQRAARQQGSDENVEPKKAKHQ
ncbi:uncharacterized protein BX663DRAFT_516489 [Cokeromyces recurvatus]|uniref:uncharacterized protein n=1 Tax=Cokeromyces recurvatus TaxID=90255 RepID=UPI00221F1C08|nr:uncharacterized protein BX663DRAFT_516489 [Cokeromyces recurvatus]KAI7900780.1 hypothetical protein BX663DRAFT_516489 [Cokeromyces recurvatus]